MYDYSNAKLKWHEICKSNMYMPIYHKDWYWDTVCDKESDWKVIIYESKDVIAGFPFQYRKIHGMWRIENPWQVARGGIWIYFSKEFSFEKKMHLYEEVAHYVIDNLPEYDYFNVKFLPDYENWSGFYWKGFTTTVNYNYIISKRTIEDVKMLCSKKRRQRINTAAKNYRIGIDEITIDEYWSFFKLSFGDRGRDISYEKKRFERLVQKLKAKKAIQIRSAHFEEQLVAVAIYLVDDKSLYHQFCANTYGNNDAQSLLTYDAICYAMETGRKFDFEGSMIKGVAEYNFSFSPETEVCLVIHDESKKYSFLNAVRNMVKRNRE